MTYHGVVLLLSGYQANEAHIIKQYHAIVDKSVPSHWSMARSTHISPQAGNSVSHGFTVDSKPS